MIESILSRNMTKSVKIWGTFVGQVPVKIEVQTLINVQFLQLAKLSDLKLD